MHALATADTRAELHASRDMLVLAISAQTAGLDGEITAQSGLMISRSNPWFETISRQPRDERQLAAAVAVVVDAIVPSPPSGFSQIIQLNVYFSNVYCVCSTAARSVSRIHDKRNEHVIIIWKYE